MAGCKTLGCGNPAVEGHESCLACHRHRELLKAVGGSRPKLAPSHHLGIERTCASCAYFVLGDRERERPWRWRETGYPVGDCRGSQPRPVDADSGVRSFARVHEDDWCRYHHRRPEDRP